MISQIANNLSIFRDDLYPFLGGGNKGRKMDAIAKDIAQKKANALVTTGGIQSNHCRAVAVFAAQHQLACSLVLHGSQEQFYKQTGNAKIMRLSGADIVFVDEAKDIGYAMDSAMDGYRKQGLNPYYIWGGGHTMEGGKAYVDAIDELERYCKQNNWQPSHLFLASGTGSTQSGILAGLDKLNIDTRVIGISVGRKTEQAEAVVRDFYYDLCKHYQIGCKERPSVVLDDYLCGGYGNYNQDIKDLSDRSLKDYGFALDTCYTAKAFYGMLDYIDNHNIDPNDVLFWHTGGVFNFLAE